MAASHNIFKTTPHLVYVRTTKSVNGETDGYVFDPYLRCESIDYHKGPSCGRATFSFVNSQNGQPIAPLANIEDVWNRYRCDHQVKVDILPRFGQQIPIIAFQGFFLKREFHVERLNATNDREGVTIIAQAMPVMENSLSEHVITGRWINTTPAVEEGEEPATPAFAVIESLDLPAVFNPKGLPNCDTAQEFQINGPTDLKAYAFSRLGDVDTGADWWTPRTAILSLLAFWLYGVDTGEEGPAALSRMTCMSKDLAALLVAGAGDASLDYRLPETNVHGLGIFDAIQKVCSAAGMSMALQPDMFDPSYREVEDRVYRLYVSLRNAGRVSNVKLQKRSDNLAGSSSSNLDRNDVSRVRLLQDGLRTYSEVAARGRTLIEASFKLKPLWSPNDIAGDGGSINDEGELEGLTPQMQDSPQISSLTYSARHVQGGAQFNQYQHVGRLWGLDCTGLFAPSGYVADPEDPKPTDGYAHTEPDQEPGFDFVSYLNLTTSPLKDERADLKITDPIVWSKRPRYPQPIRRPDGSLKGIDWVLEVSENSGASWTEITTEFRTAREHFGIMLTGSEVANLSCINLQSIQANCMAPVEESWWALLLQGKLFFRLTCSIEADHAARYDAKNSSTSSTAYSRVRYVESDIIEYWSAPTSLNALGSSTWLKLNHRGIVLSSGEYITNLKYDALLKQKSWEATPIAGMVQTWKLDFGKWRLLDRIKLIEGRNINLTTSANGGGAEIAAINVTLTEAAQIMTLQLEDTRYTEGA